MDSQTVDDIKALKEKMKPILRKIEGYAGIGIGLGGQDDTEMVLRVNATTEEARQNILKVMPPGSHVVSVIGIVYAS